MCGQDKDWCPICTPLEEWTEEEKELVRKLESVEIEVEVNNDQSSFIHIPYSNRA